MRSCRWRWLEDGYTVVGIDTEPDGGRRRQPSRAATVAWQRDRSSRTTSPRSPGTTAGSDTIIDSTLFHSLPVEGRDGYQRSVLTGPPPRAPRYYILVFAKGAFPPQLETEAATRSTRPNCATRCHVLDDRRGRPAFIHANVPQIPDAIPVPPHDRDDKGRLKFPAFLLTAHKPE